MEFYTYKVEGLGLCLGSIGLPTCLPACLLAYPAACLSIDLASLLATYLATNLPTYQPTYLPTDRPTKPYPTCLSVHVSIRLFVYLVICFYI